MKRISLVLLTVFLLAGCGCNNDAAKEPTEEVATEFVTEAETAATETEIPLFDEKIETYEGSVMKEGMWESTQMTCHYTEDGYVVEYNQDRFIFEKTETGAKIFDVYNNNVFINVDVYAASEYERLVQEYSLYDVNSSLDDTNRIDLSDEETIKYVSLYEGNGRAYVVTMSMPSEPELIEGIGQDLNVVMASFRTR